MDQELKQRLIGAAVITALAAIFIPMLFDDAVDDAGKEVNALTIPELPAKVQEVEIAPLPEKPEEVIAAAPAEKPVNAIPHLVEESDAEVDVAPAKPKLHLSSSKASDKNSVPKRPSAVVTDVNIGDDDRAEPDAEDVNPVIKLPKAPVIASTASTASTANINNPVINQAKPLKQSTKPSLVQAQPPVVKENPETVKSTATTNNDSNIRWYLNAGSFTLKANAISLQDMLKQQGIVSSLKEVSTEKGLVYKVRIGPMSDRAKAQAEKNKLSQLNVNSFLAPDD